MFVPSVWLGDFSACSRYGVNNPSRMLLFHPHHVSSLCVKLSCFRPMHLLSQSFSLRHSSTCFFYSPFLCFWKVIIDRWCLVVGCFRCKVYCITLRVVQRPKRYVHVFKGLRSGCEYHSWSWNSLDRPVLIFSIHQGVTVKFSDLLRYLSDCGKIVKMMFRVFPFDWEVENVIKLYLSWLFAQMSVVGVLVSTWVQASFCFQDSISDQYLPLFWKISRMICLGWHCFQRQWIEWSRRE